MNHQGRVSPQSVAQRRGFDTLNTPLTPFSTNEKMETVRFLGYGTLVG